MPPSLGLSDICDAQRLRTWIPENTSEVKHPSHPILAGCVRHLQDSADGNGQHLVKAVSAGSRRCKLQLSLSTLQSLEESH